MKSTEIIGDEINDDEKIIFIKETISKGGIIEVTPSEKIIENQIIILTSSNNICQDIINKSIPDEIYLNTLDITHTIIVLIHE
jgi:hypothetical protein